MHVRVLPAAAFQSSVDRSSTPNLRNYSSTRVAPPLSVAAICALNVPASAHAAEEPSGSTDPSADTETDETAPAPQNEADADRQTDRWIDRWPPERNMLELGIFGGLAFPSAQLELFEPDLNLPSQGFKALRSVAPEFGGRLGFYPLRFLGAELEGAVIPARTDAGGDRATLWAFRGHAVARLPTWSVTPFVLAGPPALGVASECSAVGRDVDLGVHFGAGVKCSSLAELRFASTCGTRSPPSAASRTGLATRSSCWRG